MKKNVFHYLTAMIFSAAILLACCDNSILDEKGTEKKFVIDAPSELLADEEVTSNMSGETIEALLEDNATKYGIFGGVVPIQKYAAGAGLGAILSASGIGGLGILVGLGFYLPFNIVLTYSLGTFTRIIVDRVKGHRFSDDVGIPIAAGLIVGEALVGVGYAMSKVFGG